MKQKNLFRFLYGSRGGILLNLALVLTALGLIAIIIFQVVDLQKYVSH